MWCFVIRIELSLRAVLYAEKMTHAHSVLVFGLWSSCSWETLTKSLNEAVADPTWVQLYVLFFV